MIQMDANTGKLGKETGDMVYIIIRRFYITLLRGSFFIYLFFLCERLITLIF